jgi:hypothetical protein
MIQFSKLIRAVAGHPKGFHVIIALPIGMKFNTGYYTTQIFERIKDWQENYGVGRTRSSSVSSAFHSLAGQETRL